MSKTQQVINVILRCVVFILPLTLYAAIFGTGISLSIVTLANGGPLTAYPWRNDASGLYSRIAEVIVVLAGSFACLFVASLLNNQKTSELLIAASIRPAPGKVRSWLLFLPLAMIGWYAAVILQSGVRKIVESVAPSWVYSYPLNDMHLSIYAYLSTGMAGLLEEILLVPVMLVCFRVAGVKTPIAITIAVACRVLFHLYYGPVAYLSHALWALVVVLAWYIFPNVWGLVVMHGLANALTLYGQSHGVSDVIETVLVLSTLILLAVIASYSYISKRTWVTREAAVPPGQRLLDQVERL